VVLVEPAVVVVLVEQAVLVEPAVLVELVVLLRQMRPMV
jgi:hypothetical protein